MQLEPGALSWGELALRFAAFTPGVTSCIVGTTRLEHLLENLVQLERGPLPEAVVAQIREAFRRSDRDWRGQV